MEVIVSDNGSTDKSVAIAESLGARVVSASQKGYGFALMAGIDNAKGKYVIMGDADDSYDFSNLSDIYEKLESGYDLVMGNRFKGGIMPGAMPFLHRYLGNPVLSFIGRLFFSAHIGDFHCGLRGFTKNAYEKMNLRTGGMEFASEMVVKSSILGLKITEVPIILHPDGRDRKPHLRTWSDGWKHLRFMMLFSPAWIFLYPGIVLMCLGLLGIGLLNFQDLQINQVRLGISTLLFAYLFIILGFQLSSFFLTARMYGTNMGVFPASDNMRKIQKYVSMEKGLILGSFLILLGVLFAALSFLDWYQTGFGDLNPYHNLRLLFPALTLIILGTQIIFSGFLISALQISTQHSRNYSGNR
jgi:glycosyltransferase involved in cell wall biosynthesis